MRTSRAWDQLRDIKMIPDWLENPPGSCLIEMGKTRVLCTAVWIDDVPPFLKGTGQGWLTCEYRMLPGSTLSRVSRERAASSGRTYEIQRLIGRSLRACLDLTNIGERTIFIDVDVLQADGGTRICGINGSVIALYRCLQKMERDLGIPVAFAFKGIVSAVSVGMVEGQILLDLEYSEDAVAEVDMNIVAFERKELVEVQGTGERRTFSRSQLLEMLSLAEKGIEQIYRIQTQVLELRNGVGN